MILPGVNLLDYTVDETGSFHGAANTGLDDILSSANPGGLCYPNMLGFVRLVTNRRVLSDPLSLEDTVNYVD